MKFLVLAIDFDGTIAFNDTLDPRVREAFAELRRRGITIILVTGRILQDLKRVCPDLHFADAVVAENGAVIEFPASGYTTALAAPPPASLLDELRRMGVVHAAGQSVIEADASEAHHILDALRRLELPLALIFNRGRVMVLPQAVSKATGLKHTLALLRLSPRNSVAIGDAENDHELLRICELGVAVGWGSKALQASADHVLRGDGPPAVASYLRSLANDVYLHVPLHTRRQLALGFEDDGSLLALAVRGRNVLVAGDPKSGKSWVTGLLCEQLIMHGYSLCIIDPEGDYAALEALPGVAVLGGADPLPRPRDLVRTLRHSDTSLVIDLSHATQDEKTRYVRSLLPGLATLRRRTGLPHRIIMDEAHYFLQDPDSTRLLDLELNGYTLVTYRASDLPATVLKSSQAVIVTRESNPNEVAALQALCSSCESQRDATEWASLFENLAIGEAVVLPITTEAHGGARRIRLSPRLTLHVRHLTKYIDVPIPEHRAFVFQRNGAGTVYTRNLAEFVSVLEHTSTPLIDGYVRRGDFSRWIGDTFGDYQLANAIRAIEQKYRFEGAPDVGERIAQEIRSRYEFFDGREPAAVLGSAAP